MMKIPSQYWFEMKPKSSAMLAAVVGALLFAAGCSDGEVSTAELEEPKTFPLTARLEDLVLRDNGLYYEQRSITPFTGLVRIHAHGFNGRCVEMRAKERGIDIENILSQRLADEDLSDERYLANLTDCIGGEGELVDGKKHGLWARFAENGMMLSMQTYENGALEGPSRIFYLRPVEQLRVERIFKAGNLESTTKYLPNGQIESVNAL